MDRKDYIDAFNAVAPKDNWKNPICAVIQRRDFSHTVAAIQFFVGGEVTALPHPDFDKVVVTSPGYYNNIGA